MKKKRLGVCLPPKQDPIARAQTKGLRLISFNVLSFKTTGICKDNWEGLSILFMKPVWPVSLLLHSSRPTHTK